jgi:hypothetical protein
MMEPRTASTRRRSALSVLKSRQSKRRERARVKMAFAASILTSLQPRAPFGGMVVLLDADPRLGKGAVWVRRARGGERKAEGL